MTQTLVQAWTQARKRLEAAGIEGPVIDARLLLEAATGATRTDILTDPHRPLTPPEAETLQQLSAAPHPPGAGQPYPRQEGLLDGRAEGHPRRADAAARHRDP